MSFKGDANPKQPKSLVVHPADFIDYMQQTLGVVNYQEDFNHFFLSAQRFITFVDQVNSALAKGVIGRPDYRLRNNPDFKPKNSLDMVNVKKIKQIWYGPTWIHMRRSKSYDIIWWDLVYSKNILLAQREELIYCPALKSMNPIEPISTNTLGIMIRDYVPIKDSWWGHDYTQMITSGGFQIKFSDGTRPILESDEDIMNSDSLVNVVSREYFHKMIDILTMKWNELNTELFIEMHQIISNAKRGGMMYEGSDENEDSMIVAAVRED
jgi:hypothetical protein